MSSGYPPVRQWKEFLDISKLSLPHPAKLQERMSTNMSYFAGNYLTIFLGSFIFTCLINPLLLFGVIFSIIGGILLRNFLERLAGQKDKKILNRNTAHMFAKWYIYGVICFLLLMGNIPLFIISFFFVCGMLAHSAIRDKSLKGKATYLMDICLDLDPISRFTRFVEGNIAQTTTDIKNPTEDK